MARENFGNVMDVIFHHEGGYVNHPSDPGGATNFGISQRSYPKEDIRNMTRARAAEIYRRDFWSAVQGDELPAGLDLVAMDAAVNSGSKRGAMWLQAALGVAEDGFIGAKTLDAARKADAKAIDRAIQMRMMFLRGLSTWPKFGKGWSRRLSETQAEAHRMFGRVIDTPVYHLDPAEAPGGIGAIISAIFAAIAALFRGKK